MIHHIFEFLKIVFVLAAIASIFYYVLCMWSAAAFLREQKTAGNRVYPTPTLPGISIFKPLKGTDPEMYDSFRSHCVQDYPEYEIIFGVSEADDPALELVKRLNQEFPQHAIRMMVCEQKLGANIKVSNLAQMAREAKYDILVVSDSDIRVPSDYLRRVVAPLSDSNVGLVTCLYRGVASGTLGSRLESLGISTDFVPGVLAARAIEGGIRFGLGSTLAFRRQDLQTIGGFESFADYLADDYELGKRIAATPAALGAHGARCPPMGLRRAWAHVRIAVGAVGCGDLWRQLDLGAADCWSRDAARGHVRGGLESVARSAGDYDASAIAAERHSCAAGLDGELCRAHGGLARGSVSA